MQDAEPARELEFQTLLSELSGSLLGASPDEADAVRQEALHRLADHFLVDRIACWTISDDRAFAENAFHWLRDGIDAGPSQVGYSEAPWYAQRILAGEIVRVSDVSRLPPEALAEQKLTESFGGTAELLMPLLVGGRPVGCSVVSMYGETRDWTDRDVTQLQLAINLVATSEARRQVTGDLVKREQELSKALAELRLSERLYASVVESQTEMIVRYRAGGIRTFVNQAYCRYFGQPAEELIGTSFLPLVADEDKHAVLAKLESMVPGAEPIKEVHRVIRPDGGEGWHEWVDVALRLPDGGVEYQAAGKDVTERVLAERSLQQALETGRRHEAEAAEQAQRFRRVFDEGPLGMALVSHDYHLTDANRALCELLGEEHDALVERDFSSITHPEDVENDLELAQELFLGKIPSYKIQKRFMRSDGSRIWGNVTCTLIRDNDGTPLYGLRIVEDVTEQKETAEDLQKALDEVKLLKEKAETENVYLRSELVREKRLGAIIGRDASWLRVLDEAERVGATDATALVLGETGTGKELIARAIHERSRRREGPMIVINAATLVGSLLESELFGHVKGSFTGASESRVGRFQLADGGTLFLDEVGELPLGTQAKLLRVLEDGVVTPVGGTESVRVDVRIIAATNRDLADAVSTGEFRSDLYFRLNVYPILLPPLRDRRGDIPELVEHFMTVFEQRHRKALEKIDVAAMQALTDYDWPGNVRELQNVTERAVIHAKDTTLTLADLRLTSEASEQIDVTSLGNGAGQSLASVEGAHILSVLERTSWVIGGTDGAARILELNENTLRSRIKKLGLRRPSL